MADEFQLTTREHSIIMFALRYLQKDVADMNVNELRASGYFPEEGPLEPITPTEIDALAEYVNCEIDPVDEDDDSCSDPAGHTITDEDDDEDEDGDAYDTMDDLVEDDDENDVIPISEDETRDLPVVLSFSPGKSIHSLFAISEIAIDEWPCLQFEHSTVLYEDNSLKLWETVLKKAPIERWGGNTQEVLEGYHHLHFTLRVARKPFAGADIVLTPLSEDSTNNFLITWPDGSTTPDVFCEGGLDSAGLIDTCSYWVEIVLPTGLLTPVPV